MIKFLSRWLFLYPIAAVLTAIFIYGAIVTYAYQEPVAKHWPPKTLKTTPMKR